MPNVRLRPSIFNASCVAVHCANRDSNGCELSRGIEPVPAAVDGSPWATGPMPERRVSWMPGADGAPRDVGLRWLWVLECELAGAMRIAYEECELLCLRGLEAFHKEDLGIL